MHPLSLVEVIAVGPAAGSLLVDALSGRGGM